MPISNLTYYELLELPRDASKADVKRAYRKMAEDYHPDKTMHLGKRLRELANLEMARINKAKEVLLDDEKRSRYNKYLDGGHIEDIEDIVLEIDPFEEFEEENWEELRDEILEVEPIDEPIAVKEYEGRDSAEPVEKERGAEPIQPSVQGPAQQPVPQRVSPPSAKPPFWERVKSTVQLREMRRRRKDKVRADAEFLEKDWIDGLRKVAPTPRRQYEYPPKQDKDIMTAEVISKRSDRHPSRTEVKPPDDDIRVSIIVDPQEQPPADERGRKRPDDEEIWDKHSRREDEHPDYSDAMEFEEIEPLEMEIVEKAEAVAKKRKSRLKGMEPREDYVPKWSDQNNSKKPDRADKDESLEDWTAFREKDDKEDAPPEDIKEYPMDLEPMEMEIVKEDPEPKPEPPKKEEPRKDKKGKKRGRGRPRKNK